VHAGVIRFVSRGWAGTSDRAAMLRAASFSWAKKLPWLVLMAIPCALAAGQFKFAAVALIFPSLVVAASLLSASALGQTALQAARQNWHDFAVACSGSLTRTFLPPLLFVALGSASGLYVGFCFHAVCVAGVAFGILRKQNPPSTGGAANIESVYDGPLFVSLALANWTLTGVNRWIVAWAYGETTAGLFTLASNIALIVPAVSGAIFLQYFQPTLFAMVDAAGKGPLKQLARRVDQVVIGLCIVGLIGLGIVRIITPRLVGSLIARPYAEALDWILPAGCFGLTVTAAQFYHVFMIAIRKEKACASVDLSTAGVLTLGCIVSAWFGTHIFAIWLTLTPLVLFIITRPLARRWAQLEPNSPSAKSLLQ